ncbi:hypothetical protein RhiirA4_487991 [Rhizophagus irregularis]|uniref:BAH domain-containing protein n=2 Tax=Rhizophagus irregularis TaxID=588596 RepID=A0A2I1HT75_9GLOM|nr:hypothetical protein RhiirA4_487991 [Rhizophagus irregularis]
MYFGPGIYSDDKRELWHGDIWHKSPLFGSTCIQINNVKYNLGEFVEWHGSNSNTETSVYYGRIVGFIIHDKSKQPLVKVEQIINFDSLPRSLKSRQRKNQSHIGMLWMTDKSIIIEPTIIESKIRVWLTDINQPDRYEYFIEEIVYIANGIWTIRSINLRHRHPIEYIQIQDSPRELPIYKFFLDIYIDKFGPFRNAYHAIGGVYLQVGNMPQVLRQKLKNHFLLGFIPFAATCDDVLKPLVSDIKELESGFEMDLGDERIWIMGGLGDITSDLPEGNEQAGVKNHNANYGCRNCTIHRNELHDMSFDILANGRYHHNTTLQINELNNTRTQGERDSLSTQYGIRNKPSIFDNVIRDRHLQCPHDAFHCMGGLANQMLQATFSILTSKGEGLFSSYNDNALFA